ncbi:MAG TPA: glycosyltransferase [Gemmatimonadales bacterium]|nr:glycosyltransferase [Gemmatimonadales bacterium]
MQLQEADLGLIPRLHVVGTPAVENRRSPVSARTTVLSVPSATTTQRATARGKFLYIGDEKVYVRGVTYGTFRPRADDTEVPEPEVVERDFALMAANGINALRTYSVPPRWLLDAAERHGLHVMVGLPVERYIGFLADKSKNAPDIEGLVRAGVRACAGHSAVLCYAIGNEIPASVARWFGRRRVERYLERLYRAAKDEAPDSLVTYVNYPSTEYLRLDFLDLVCYNVYLESQERLHAYLARLQTLAGERPLMMSEIGLDSRRHGEHMQARTLDWQVRSAFAAGCAGAFVYAWTDEWHRAGEDVLDWDFGLTRRDRQPKPALRSVRDAFAEVPFAPTLPWPRISVVVCSYNGARTIRECLEGLKRLAYADYEVIVVDDGSTDRTAAIAQQYDCRLIRTPNRGLSRARNTGLEAATGEIVAYLDDDAYPDPHWLSYLAATFLGTSHAAVGGPNIVPPGDGPIAQCVARSPGGPVHVLLTDREAEHIPGCNMAFRTTCLEAIGGFDARFRVAGDDVDVCWRLQARGWTLGFSPAAMVWHHRRNSIRAYWRQQIGYGRAEAMLERKWPEKYNAPGHVRWAGRLYGSGLPSLLGWRRPRVYHGIWGEAPYQSLWEPRPSLLGSLPQMPEWHLMTAILGGIAALSVAWSPLRFALPLLAVAISVPIVQAGVGAARAWRSGRGAGGGALLRRLLTGGLHLLQPLARLHGRLKEGLTPWRCHGTLRPAPLRPVTTSLWEEQWRAPDARLQSIEATLRAAGACVLRGGPHDRWDLEVRGGFFGTARMLMGVEEHGGGRQLVRLRCWPDVPVRGPVLSLALAALAVGAAHDHAWAAAAVLGLGALLPVLKALEESAIAMATLIGGLRSREEAHDA